MTPFVKLLQGHVLSCLRDLADESVHCVVLDPFAGSGTTLLVANKLGRSAIGIELKPEYVVMTQRRIERDCGLLTKVEVA